VLSLAINNNKTYNKTNLIPEEFLNKEIKNIKIDNNKIIIILGEETKGKNLEDLGYSFEVGI